jgi:hypothetical protein
MEPGDRDEFLRGDAQILRGAPLLASCFWCETPHPAQGPLSVCPRCVGAYRPRSYPLGLLEMSGPYPLTDEAIDGALARTSPGNYALGYMEDAAFVVFYVGRADSDLKQCLHGWVGAPSRYERHAPSTRAACGRRHRGMLPFDAPALDLVGMDVDSSYTRFAYSTTPSADAAFEKECRNYHDFGASGGLDNAVHPVPLPGSSARCLAHERA